MRYVLIRSWHVIAVTNRAGSVRTRCGRGPLTITGTLAGGLGPLRAVTDDLPVNEKTCERCLALTLNDRELEQIPNDPVDPGPSDDPVPG